MVERVIVGRGTTKRYPGYTFAYEHVPVFVVILKGTPDIRKSTRGNFVKIKNRFKCDFKGRLFILAKNDFGAKMTRVPFCMTGVHVCIQKCSPGIFL